MAIWHAQPRSRDAASSRVSRADPSSRPLSNGLHGLHQEETGGAPTLRLSFDRTAIGRCSTHLRSQQSRLSGDADSPLHARGQRLAPISMAWRDGSNEKRKLSPGARGGAQTTTSRGHTCNMQRLLEPPIVPTWWCSRPAPLYWLVGPRLC
jgi:hypothetical protein